MRRIFTILAIGLVIYLFRRLSRHRAERAAATPPDAGRPLVRDRVCNTYLPPASALRFERGGEVHYFCSEACRDKYLAAAG